MFWKYVNRETLVKAARRYQSMAYFCFLIALKRSLEQLYWSCVLFFCVTGYSSDALNFLSSKFGLTGKTWRASSRWAALLDLYYSFNVQFIEDDIIVKGSFWRFGPASPNPIPAPAAYYPPPPPTLNTSWFLPKITGRLIAIRVWR